MGWVVGGAWIGAVLVAVVTLAFCGYEIAWKSRRLQREGARLQALGQRAQALQAEVAAIQQRAAGMG